MGITAFLLPAAFALTQTPAPAEPVHKLDIVPPVVNVQIAGVQVKAALCSGLAETRLMDQISNGAGFDKLEDGYRVKFGGVALPLGPRESFFGDSGLFVAGDNVRMQAGTSICNRLVMACIDGKFVVMPDTRSLPAKWAAKMRSATKIPLTRDADGRPICTAIVDGVKLTNCVVDTGSPMSMLDPASFRLGPAEWAANLTNTKLSTTIELVGDSGMVFGVGRIAFSPTCQTEDVLLLDQANREDPRGGVGRYGPTIGLSTLCKFDWVLDPKGKALWLKPKPVAEAPVPPQSHELKNPAGNVYAVRNWNMYFSGAVNGRPYLLWLDTGTNGTALLGRPAEGPDVFDKATPDATVRLDKAFVRLGKRPTGGSMLALMANDAMVVLGVNTLDQTVIVHTGGVTHVYGDWKDVSAAVRGKFAKATAVPLGRDYMERPTCTIKFDGVKFEKCVIDTGSAVTMLDTKSFAKGPAGWRTGLTQGGPSVLTWTGFEECSWFVAKTVSFGPEAAIHEDVLFLSAGLDAEEGDPPATPVIGMNTLCRFDWVLDLKGRRLLIKPIR